MTALGRPGRYSKRTLYEIDAGLVVAVGAVGARWGTLAASPFLVMLLVSLWFTWQALERATGFEVTYAGMSITEYPIFADDAPVPLVGVTVRLFNKSDENKASLSFVLQSPLSTKKLNPVTEYEANGFRITKNPLTPPWLFPPVTLDPQQVIIGLLMFVDFWPHITGAGPTPTKELRVIDAVSGQEILVNLGGPPDLP